MTEHKQRRCAEEDNLAQNHHGPAVVPVRDMAREKGEQQERRYLDEADVAQHERRMRLGVKIPAYCDGKHLQAEVG